MKKFLIILATLFVMIPASIKAENKQDLQGVVLANPGDIITYKIETTTDVAAYAYQVELSYASDLFEFQGIAAGAEWTLKSDVSLTKTPLDLSFESNGASGYTGKSTVATITFKIKDNITKSSGNIKLSNAKIVVKDTDSDGKVTTDLSNKNITKTVSIKSTDNTLKKLTIDKKSVNNFSPTTYEYVMQVDSSVATATIEATMSSTSASFVTGAAPRKVSLEYGDNVFELKIKSEAGDIKTYTITINRLDNRGTNNNLKEIIINNGKIKLPFSKDVTNYKLNVYRLTKLEVEALAEDSNAKVVIDKPQTIGFGESIIKITVTSETKEDKVYTITLTNIDSSIDTTLKTLELYLSGETFEFDRNIFDYEVKYNSKYKDGIVIKKEANIAESEGVHIDNALLESTNKNLKVGSVIKLRVYADDGTETLYTITLIKNDKVNFFLILGLIILFILIIIFIKTYISRKRINKEVEELQKNIEKTIEMKF